MARLNYGRHLPAFILLFLAKEPAYGSMLLNKMEEYLPYNNSDSPAIYRTLNDLEQSKAVESQWDTSLPGAAKKYYKITSKGLKELKKFKSDIEQRKKNFDYFLSEYENLNLDQEEI
ncbi:MAG: PadR family transcriptional regulator [Sedimentibacter sp.]